MTDLVFIARRRTRVDNRTHYPGCERDHTECLIQRMADEIERRDEWREWATAEIERLHADNQAAVIAYAAEITEAKAEIERLRAALEKAHDVWEAEAAEMRNDIDRLRAELERNTDTALEMAIDACIAIHATTATTHAANSVRSCVDAIRALKDVK